MLKYLLRKEFRQIFRNKGMLPVIFMMPVIQLLIIPWAVDFNIKNISLAVVDHDHSTYSHNLTNKIFSSGYFTSAGQYSSFNEAFTLIEKDEADIILEIPQNFESQLVREGSQTLFVAANAINGTRANLGTAYLNSILNTYNREIVLQWAPGMSTAGMQGIEITSSDWYNPLTNYQFFMVPAILVMLVSMVGCFLTSLNIVREKEIGTIEQINVSPVSKLQFILGKIIPFWLLGLFIFSLGLVLARFVYGIVPQGSLATLYLFTAVYLIALIGFGMLISTYSNTQQEAMFIAFFFIMIFILMSGLFTSIDNMPEWAKIIARFNPLSYFVKSIRMIVLKGSSFTDILPNLGYIGIFAVVFNTWAVLNYRKTN